MSPSRHILALVILYSMGCQRRKKTTTQERPRIHQYQRKEQDARGGTGNVYQPEVMKTILIHYHFVICHPSRSLESCPLQMTMTCLPPAIDNLTRSNAFIPSNTCNVKCFTLRSFFFFGLPGTGRFQSHAGIKYIHYRSSGVFFFLQRVTLDFESYQDLTCICKGLFLPV